MSEVKHTSLPWKMVSAPNFDNGYVYTSIQPVNVDEDTMKPLAMAGGEYHVCRMSHTAAEWRFSYHRENAAFIVRACNSHYELLEALRQCASEIGEWSRPKSSNGMTSVSVDHPLMRAQAKAYEAIAKAGGRA